MASPLPAKLKTAEIQRFAKRAAQLEKFRPIVTYWCQYYILQQIMLKQLHTADSECSTYAVQLMDKLEHEKEQNATNDAVVDDVAAKAYIENFALETFKRADDAQRNNRVTVQTADTFQAASTFLDLLTIWGELDKDIAAKSKFAKYHAMRILKAVKAGDDPNATNPVVEDVAAAADPAAVAAAAPPQDELETELKLLESQANGGQQSAQSTATTGSTDEHASDVFQDANSTQQSTPHARTDRQHSVGGGYFPVVAPDPPVDVNMDDVAVPAPSPPPRDPLSQLAAQSSGQDATAPPPSAFPNPLGPFHQGMQTPSSLATSDLTPRNAPVSTLPPQQTFNAAPAATIPSIAPVPSMPLVQAQQPTAAYRTDDEATMAATKHARWAISALNFEDVNTAVKELHLALQSLGAE